MALIKVTQPKKVNQATLDAVGECIRKIIEKEQRKKAEEEQKKVDR